jgi:hypothetical protein
MKRTAPGDDKVVVLPALSADDRERTAQLIKLINLRLLGERSAVAMCALTAVLAVVVAELEAKHDVPISGTLRMLFPLVKTQAEELLVKTMNHRPGHA